MEYPAIQDAVQNLVAFVAAGPAARVPQKMDVFKKGRTKEGCKLGIILLKPVDEFSYESGLHCHHWGAPRDFRVHREERGQLLQDGKFWQDPMLAMPRHECD
jgi:hypothetical protein